MKTTYKRHALMGCIFIATAVGADSSERNPYLNSVQKFADTVLEHGRDSYGEVTTPLFVDGLHAETLEPAVWIWRDGETWVTSNFATQQPLMQILDALTSITGNENYRTAAEAAAGYMLENPSPSGLLAWGDHTAWDLASNMPVGTTSGKNPPERWRFVHDLKTYPYYELMWRVNPEAARRVMFGFWKGHITDWETLDFNRHGRTHRSLSEVDWDNHFDGDRNVPHEAAGGHLSFAGIVPVFLQAGFDLWLLSDDEDAFTWSDRMITQWRRNRNPETGLGGGQISWRGGGEDRIFLALGHLYPEINEATLIASYHHARYSTLLVAQLSHAERMLRAGKKEDRAREYIAWASEDLKAYALHVYDRDHQRFRTMMTDGTPITDEDIAQIKPGYYTEDDLLPVAPSATNFRAYAKAYLHTKDPIHWSMLQELGRYFDLGEFGSPDGQGRALNLQTDSINWPLMYGLLDLVQATPGDDFMALARRLGDNLVAMQSPTGLYPRPAPRPRPEGTAADHAKIPGTVQPARQWARTGDEVPLALLHLGAALSGQYMELPQPPTVTQRFHNRYWGPMEPYQQKRDDSRTHDYLIFYGPGLEW